MAMGIRETIKNHTPATVIVTLIVAAGALAYSLRSSGFGPPTASTQAFYTTDDGQTTFVADMKNLPPFLHDGKQAVRAWVFTCDGGKTTFVGYLERYTPESHKRLSAALAEQLGKPDKTPSLTVGPTDSEVKKPGPGNPWVTRANAQAAKVTHVTCPGSSDPGTPDGGTEPELVLP